MAIASSHSAHVLKVVLVLYTWQKNGWNLVAKSGLVTLNYFVSTMMKINFLYKSMFLVQTEG